MPAVFVVTILAIAAGRFIRHALGIPRLAVAGPLVGGGLIVWLVASRLHAGAMRRAALGIAAGSGRPHGVPRWIEELRNGGFGLLLAGSVALVDALVPE